MRRRDFLKTLMGAAAAIVVPVPASSPVIKETYHRHVKKPVTVEVETRRIRVWSYEAAQDLRSIHNLNAEKELAAVMAEEINKEIDAEVIAECKRWRVRKRWNYAA